MISHFPELLQVDGWNSIPNCRFFYTMGEVLSDPLTRKVSHHIRRANEQIQWNGVLSISGKPVVYFKQVPERDLKGEAELHRKLWNQSIANVLVVTDSANVRIYSALSLPRTSSISINDNDERLVESLSLVDFILQSQQFALKLENGQYYKQHSSSFSSNKSVNAVLLSNLRAARDELVSDNTLSYSEAHTLLSQVLFICYLHARGIISNAYFREAGAPEGIDSLLLLFKDCAPKDAIRVFQRLTQNLHDEFNGSLFDRPLMTDSNVLSASHIATLGGFLNGDNLRGHQLALGFPAYDFSLIPIETISAIYEDFLSAESQQGQRISGAYYTPKSLAELTVDIATEGWDSLLDKKCLDPSCGSGIFLVTLFSRMAEEWRWRNPKASLRARSRKLISLLRDNLYGVDVNETACHITAFSLYVAFLDQFQPRDIKHLKSKLATEGEKLLPRLVKENTPDADGVIQYINFFDPVLNTLCNFDLVIGNPPWTGRNQAPDPIMEAWLFDQELNPNIMTAAPYGTNKKSTFLPQDQAAHAFMWKAPWHVAKDRGRVCLILPSKVWLNESTNQFQRAWSKHYRIEELWELADYSFILFNEANCPASIARFLPSPPSDNDYAHYFAPKVTRTDPEGAIVVVDSADVKDVSLKEWHIAAELGGASIFWKKLLWGNEGDAQFIERLRRMPSLHRLTGEPTPNWPHDGPRWIKGQGFQPYFTNKQRAEKSLRPINESDSKTYARWWNESHQFVDARCKALDLCLPSDGTATRNIGKEPAKLRRSPDKRLFEPPMVLISQGFGRIAYCDYDVLFQDSLQSIKGPLRDSDLLMFLSGVLNTPLIKYYLFHTSSNWGVERDKVHFSELLHLPFPLPEQTPHPERSQEIVELVAERIQRAMKVDFTNREFEIETAKQDIQKWVYEYYGVSPQEAILIDDAIAISIPSSTPHTINWKTDIPSLRVPNPEQRQTYAHLLCDTLNRWLPVDGLSLASNVHLSSQLGLAVVTLWPNSTSTVIESESQAEVQDLLASIYKRLEDRRRTLVIHRGLIYFDGESVHLLKPLALRYWSQSAALNDANTIFSALARN